MERQLGDAEEAKRLAEGEAAAAQRQLDGAVFLSNFPLP